MFCPHFTDQEIAIDGTWQGDDHQLRFIGTISSSAPFVVLSLLKCGDAFHYMKHSKSSDLEVLLTLYQSKFPHQNRYQHSLMLGHSVNTGAISAGCLFLANELPMTFQIGQLFAFGMDFQNQPFIYLIAIARDDIKSKRCGIWAAKPQLLEGVDELWLNVFSKTRHGLVSLR
jgi:hypothetical protein